MRNAVLNVTSPPRYLFLVIIHATALLRELAFQTSGGFVFSISGVDALDSSRPVIFNAGGGSIFETWRSGTGFLLRLHHTILPARDFFITAHHVFKAASVTIDGDLMEKLWLFDSFVKFGRFQITKDILIPIWAYHSNPFRESSAIKNIGEDAADLAILELRPGALDNSSGVLHVRAAPIADKTCDSRFVSSLPDDCLVWISGFPTYENSGGTIDYDGETIMFNRIRRKARLRGNSYSPFIYKTIFDADADISFGLDGLSGSPIFYEHGDIFRFLGMALRGTESSRTVHFLGAELILQAIMMVDVRTVDWHSRMLPDAYALWPPK